jgi:hypothetical protein
MERLVRGFHPGGLLKAIRLVMVPAAFVEAAIAQQFGKPGGGAGSGGPSGCATGVPAVNLVVGGSCQGYAKPAWQTGVAGIPNDGVRDLPDVSLFASNGVWGHYYVVCFTDAANFGAPCTGAPINWAGAGGTSFASPILAGIQALVNQKMRAPRVTPILFTTNWRPVRWPRRYSIASLRAISRSTARAT